MDKIKIIIILFLVSHNLFAQQQQDSIMIKEILSINNNVSQQRQGIEELNKKLENQEYVVGKQKQNIEKLEKINNSLNSSIDSLNQLVQTNSKNIAANTTAFGTQIQKVTSTTNSQISELDSSLEKNRLYWIIATLATLLLGGLVYLILGKRMLSDKNEVKNQIQSSKTDVETQIKNTRTFLDEESVKLYSKLMEVFEAQLILKEMSQTDKPEGEEKDHSLVLKVAEEVTKIQMSLEVMDENIKGYKFLKKYATSILDNLRAYGYEIPELIGQNYNSGMNMVARMEFDDSIEKGKQIIKRINKPQINYNGSMIQAANVIVAFNE